MHRQPAIGSTLCAFLSSLPPLLLLLAPWLVLKSLLSKQGSARNSPPPPQAKKVRQSSQAKPWARAQESEEEGPDNGEGMDDMESAGYMDE